MKLKKEEFRDDLEEDDLSLASKDTKAWLVKLPNFLFEHWASQQQRGLELGRLRIYKETTKNSLGKEEPKVTLSLSDSTTVSLPKHYNLRFTNVPTNEYIFTEKDGKALEIAGHVQHEATIGPVIDDEYRRIMQERSEQASTKSRVSQMMDTKETKSHGFRVGRDFSTGGFGSMRKKDPTLDKRERLPRSAVLDILFAEFEKYPYWTFKGLAERTNQPHAWLKECLAEVAMLNKRGPYVGMYQLLPEYRQKQATAATDPGSST